MNKYTVYNKAEKKEYKLTSRYLYGILQKAKKMKQEAVLFLEIPLKHKQTIELECKINLKG